MPILDGPGLHAALAREKPSYLTRIIYVTGDTLSTHVQAFLHEYPVPVIEKPYRLDDVRRAIATLLKENASESSMGAGDSTLPSSAQPALQR
jgi:FixJ family two-component response regulator